MTGSDREIPTAELPSSSCSVAQAIPAAEGRRPLAQPGCSLSRPTSKGSGNVLIIASEYGEFFDLMRLARQLRKELDLHSVFVFGRGYGAVEAHRVQAERNGFSWVAIDEPNVVSFVFLDSETADGYLPSSGLNVASLAGSDRPRFRTSAKGKRTRQLIGPILMLLAPVSNGFDLAARVYSRLRRQRRRMANGAISLALLAGTYRRLSVEELQLSRIIDIVDPLVLISGQDFPVSTVAIASNIGERQGLKHVIVPFAMGTTKEISESLLQLGSKVRGRFDHLLFRWIGHRWLHRYRGNLLTRGRLDEVIATRMLDIEPPVPWMPHSGRGTVLCMCQQHCDYYAAAGIPRSQLVLTGALWNDDLAKAVATRDSRRDVLIARIDDEAKKVVRAIEWIDQHRVTISGNEVLKAARDFARFSQVFRFSKQDAPVVLISWPTNQYPRRADNFATYAKFSEALIEVLLNVNRECSVRVAVSLHPTLVHTEVYRSIEEAGLYVIDAPLIEVIDCADLFVACVSSTIFWAVQLNIPTVNIDFYDYHYSEFDEAGCETVFNLSAFERELRRLLTDPAHLEALQTRMRVNADYWTMGDGRSAERIVEAIVARMSPDSTQSVLSP